MRLVRFVKYNSEIFVLNFLNFVDVRFGGCGPDLMSVCDDRSNTYFVEVQYNIGFQFAISGYEWIKFMECGVC